MIYSKEKNKSYYLSIVIPLYNEEANVEELYKLLVKNLKFLKENYEILFIDDGSLDKTWQKISFLSLENKNVISIRLSRNFGKQHALLAGLSHSSGQAIITIDGDLQHPPSLIERMIEKHKQGYKIVTTHRNYEQATSFFKRKSSFLFYKVFSFLADFSMSPGSSDFLLLDKIVLNQVLKLQNVDLFFRGAIEWLGFKSTKISYNADKRFSGDSKFTIAKLFNQANGSIISFSTKPLIVSLWIGIITSLLALFEIVYVIIQWLNGAGDKVPGWASTIIIVSFFFGILFILLGVIGSYLARIHIALQNRPRFVISEITSSNKES